MIRIERRGKRGDVTMMGLKRGAVCIMIRADVGERK
jgi:hypothetical protein